MSAKPIPTLPPPPEHHGRGNSGNGNAIAERQKRREQRIKKKKKKKKKQRQDGLVQGEYVPSKKTLGLELVADPQLLANNSEWKEGDVADSTLPLASSSAAKGVEKQSQQQRSIPKIRRLGASQRDTPSKTAAAAVSASGHRPTSVSVAATRRQLSASSSSTSATAPSSSTKAKQERIQQELRLQQSEGTKQQTFYCVVENKKNQQDDDSDKPFDETNAQESSVLLDPVTVATEDNQPVASESHEMELQEAQIYLNKAKDLESIKAARAGRVRSFFSAAATSPAKNNVGSEEEREDATTPLKQPDYAKEADISSSSSKKRATFRFGRKKSVKTNKKYSTLEPPRSSDKDTLNPSSSSSQAAAAASVNVDRLKVFDTKKLQKKSTIQSIELDATKVMENIRNYNAKEEEKQTQKEDHAPLSKVSMNAIPPSTITTSTTAFAESKLVSPTIVRDRRARKTMQGKGPQLREQLQSRHQDLAGDHQQQKRVSFLNGCAHHARTYSDGTPNNAILANTAGTTPISPTSAALLDPTIRDYFCTPTVSHSEIHDKQGTATATATDCLPMPPVMPGLGGRRELVFTNESSNDSSSPVKVNDGSNSISTPVKNTFKRLVSEDSPTGVDELLLEKPITLEPVTSIVSQQGYELPSDQLLLPATVEETVSPSSPDESTTSIENNNIPATAIVIPSSPDKTWNSDDTEKTMNTLNTSSERIKEILENAQKDVDAKNTSGRSSGDASKGDSREVKATPSAADDANKDKKKDGDGMFSPKLDLQGIASDLLCLMSCGGCNSIEGCWEVGHVVDDGAPDDEKMDDVAMKRKKWKEAQAAAVAEAADVSVDVPFNVTDDDGGYDYDDDDDDETQNENDVKSVTKEDWEEMEKKHPLFQPNFNQSKRNDSDLAESQEMQKQQQREMFSATWDGQPTDTTVTTASTTTKRTVSFDSSEHSQLSIVEETPILSPNLSVSNVELELDGDKQLLKVMPQSTTNYGPSSLEDAEFGAPPTLMNASFANNGGFQSQSQVENEEMAREGSYSSLSIEARQLLAGISRSKPVLDGIAHQRGEDGSLSKSEMQPPQIQRAIQPEGLFDQIGGGSDEGELCDGGTVSTSGSSPGSDRRSVKSPRNHGDDRTLSPCHTMEEDGTLLSREDYNGIEDASTIDDASTYEHTLDNSTLNSTQIVAVNESSCDAIPDMSSIALASWQGSFLNVIDKIDDAINGRVEDTVELQYYSDSDDEEPSL